MSYLAAYVLAVYASVNTPTINITAISVVNIGILLWLSSRSPQSENRQAAVWSHGLWSGMWLAWLLAWVVAPSSFTFAVVLEDVGSFLLIGSAVARLWGMPALRRYANISYPTFVFIDLVWVLLIRFEWHRRVASSPDLDIFLNTLLYAPSLCLVVFAIGLFGWGLLRLQVSPLIRFTAGFAAGGYALLQVLIYQVTLFDPIPLQPVANTVLWKALGVTWRSFFVIVYWAETLAWVGVRLPAGPTKEILSKLGWLPPVIASVILERYLK
jgi:hypothetical protein